MSYCRRCSKGTTEGSAVIVCGVPFLPSLRLC